MHNFIKILSAAMLCALLCSCAGRVTVEMIDKSYATDSVKVNAQIPQLSGLPGKDLQESVNKEIFSAATELLDSFSQSAKETGEQSVFDMQTTEYYNRNNFLSLVTQIDYFARKTHKNSCRITKNINAAEGCEIRLGDLFEDDGYIDTLNAQIEREITEHPEKYADLWQKPRITQNQCFYIDGSHLVLYYPPYELSYYERGFVEIPVNLEDLSICLKEEYRNIFLR
ncbi:MAG: DUF3298 domain-containing protein [Clostridiales bacterium]|nr:DUF3298 domain-containing protein [Clostridiales bacterium]